MNLDNIIMSDLYGGLVNTQKKIKSSYTNEQVNAIKNVALNMDEAYPFGSASYRVQRWPGDLDIREKIIYYGSLDNIVKHLASRIKKMISVFNKQKMSYFGEIKTGLDHRFNIYIGEMSNGKVINYDANMIRYNIKKNISKIITKDELNNLLMLIPDNITVPEWDNLSKTIRDYFILRWSDKEILQGFKILPGGHKKNLTDALKDKTMLKIDTWQFINGRFVEVTNFYIVIDDSNGKYAYVNLPDDFATRAEKSLLDEIDKLSCSGTFFKPLKAVKRMWTVAMLRDDKNMLDKLTPLINSDIGLLNQINGDIESIIGILEKISNLPIASIRKEIDNFKARLAHISQINLDFESFNNIFDELQLIKDKYLLREELKNLKKQLQKIINHESIHYLLQKGLYPIPFEYLPTKSSYCH